MWRNYLTVGFRALAKNKVYTFINVLGLAIGLAACLLILVYVRYERSYDEWLPDSERIYQFQILYQSKTSSDRFDNQGAPYVTMAPLAKDFPQIEHAVYVSNVGGTLLKDGQANALESPHFVNGDFLDVLPLPMVKGDSKALSEPGTAVFTEREARKYFGTTDIIGQVVTLVVGGVSADYRVTGILRDLPRNSHFEAGLIARIDFQKVFGDSGYLTAWGWTSGWVYAKLRPGADVAAVNSQFEAWKKRNIPDETFNGQRTNAGDERTYRLVNVRDVHLGTAQGSSMTAGNDTRTIATFAIVALLILTMACINFTNLATARASQRAREVALRKVLGATRRQLIVQFLSESILVASIAMVVALALTELCLPWFAAFLDADLTMRYFGQGGVILPIVGLVLLVGGAGGLYPAFYLSRFQPARILKANKSSEVEGSGRLRGALVVVQFAISIGLMICTGIVYGQAVYARSVDPGFKRDGLLQISGIGNKALMPNLEALTQRIAALPGVTSVGRTSIGVATGSDSNTTVNVQGRSDSVQIGVYGTDAGFFRTIGVEPLAGRLFDANRPADDMTTPIPEEPAAERALVARGGNIVINLAGVKRLGLASPADAIGKVLTYGAPEEYGGVMKLTIIGVVPDSRFRSVTIPLEPIMFMLERHNVGWMLVRYAGDPRTVRGRIEKVWREIAPEVPFNARFSDEIIGNLYQRIDARAQMFAAFSLLAIIVGCLGLFGLAAFTAERRTKEIGIRKVLGARARDIVKLLVWQFSRPVLIANLIAWPIAWWVMRDWLNQFDLRMPLGPSPFVAAGGLALVVATVTIASHAFRVARTNPIHALRYE